MKRIFLIVAALLLLAISASAQGVKPFTLYLGGGASLPNGDFSNEYKMGLHATLGLGLNFGPGLQFVPKGEFHTFSADTDALMEENDYLSVSGGSFNAFLVGADLKLTPPLPGAPLKPYLFGGGGWARLQPSDLDYENSLGEGTIVFAKENKFYWNVGGGLNLGSGPAFSFFLQARYLSISGDEVKYNAIPITLGIKF
ncbi:MAG: outer membrane beta-barrel protein [bacterium]|nr:outer membrane beta-barrel protein [bacterium]